MILTEPDMTRDYCREYLDNGVSLIPLKIWYKDGVRKVTPLTAILNEAGDGYAPGAALENYGAFYDYIMTHPDITMMGLYPKFANMVVLDLDNAPTHANKANGLENFVDVVSRANLASKWSMMFADFPHNFPCYTVTPSGGIHLYFKADYIPATWNKETVKTNSKNIEIKYNTQVTAAGSIRDDGVYYMVGRLQDAPAMTTDLLDLFTKPAQEPFKPKAQKWQTYTPPQESKSNWEQSPESVIAKCLEKYGDLKGNDFAYKSAILFKKSGFDQDTAIQYITDTYIHQERRDKRDTITAIKGIYRRG